ncbi:GNAT family N-acetyltransferase [bacterium]|nr:GNAT family N-acetyltransferase [bacterium]
MNCTEKYQLFADEFTHADQPDMADLQCGEESWSRAATKWITSSEVIDSIEKFRTTVWTYRDSEDSIIGFGSLAPTGRQRWPPPDGKKSRLLYIPQLGIDAKFRGYPQDPTWRYSNQIMEHLLFQAKKMALKIRDEKPPSKHVNLLTLKVHRDNIPAQKVYERFGFVLLEGFEDKENLMMSHNLDLESE